jgi:hypothetical protein
MRLQNGIAEIAATFTKEKKLRKNVRFVPTPEPSSKF